MQITKNQINKSIFSFFLPLLALLIATGVPSLSIGQCTGGVASCSVTITGSNYDGTSWYGASIEVWQDTVLRGTFTLAEHDQWHTEDIAVCSGVSLRFVWRSGVFDDNCHFSIYYADGVPILEDVWSDYSDGETVIVVDGYCPTCQRPQNLTAVNQTDALTLSWTPMGSETSWIVTVGDSVYLTTTEPFTVSNLALGTAYDVSVRALCGDGDTSTALRRTFATLAVQPIDTLPWTCSFSTEAERACWHIFNGDMGPIHEHYKDQWVINQLPDDTTGHDWALYITDDIIAQPNHHQVPWQSTPRAYVVFDLERGEYQCSFDWRANGGQTLPSGGFTINNYLRVFMLPDSIINMDNVSLNAIPAGGIPVDGGYGLTGVTEWQTYDAHFSIKESGRYKMVFFWRNMSEEAQPPAAVDNISLARVPCAAPVDLVCMDSTYESLTVSWTPLGDESEWIVDWGEGYDIAFDTVHVIQWLDAGTAYNVTVRALCGDGDTSLAVAGTYTTQPTDPTGILPFHCDFEDSTTSRYWILNNGSQRNRWCIGEAVNNTPGGSHALYISSDSGATNAYISTKSDVFAYVFIEFDTGTYEYSYDWKCMGASVTGQNRGYLLSAVVPGDLPMTAGMQGSWLMTWNGNVSHPQGTIPIDGNSPLNNVNEWQNRSGVFHITEPGLYKLVFFWHNSDGTTFPPPAAVDNVHIVRASCLPPTNLAVTADSNSLTLTWHPVSGESVWMVKTDGFIQTVYDTVYTLQNLNPGRLYTVGVSAVCSEGITSTWSNIDVYTDCGTITAMPWVEDFQDAHWFQCWETLNNGEPQINWMVSIQGLSNGVAVSYCVSLEPENDWLITPPVRLQNTSGHNLRWRVSGNPYDDNHDDHFTVLISNAYDFAPSTFTDTLFSDYISNVWTDYMVDLSAYNGQTVRVAFIHDGYAAWLYFDDVVIEERPSCPPPLNLAVVRTTNSAELTWQPDGNENQWEVKCGSQTAVVGTTNYTFNSLQPGTEYTFAVRAICGSGDTSEYSTITRTTLYHPAIDTLPYYCPFGDSEAYNWTIMCNPNRNCWYVGSAAYFGTSDSMGLYVSSDQGATNQYYAFPTFTNIYAYRTFNLSAGDYNCSFMWRSNGYSQAELRVYLIPSDVELHYGTDFRYNGQTPIGTITMAPSLRGQTEWEQFYREFTVPDNGQYNLTFMWYNYAVVDTDFVVGDYQPPAAIDNVGLRYNTCPIIQHLTAVDIGTNSVQLDWNDQGASQWKVEYGPMGFGWGSGSSVIVDSHPWTLTGLDSLATYDVLVSPICGAGDTGMQKMITVGTGFCNNAAHAAVGNFGADGKAKTSILAPIDYCILTEVIVDASELYPGMTINGLQLFYDSDVPITGDTAVDIYLQPTNKNSFDGEWDVEQLHDILGVHVFHGSFGEFAKGWNSVIFDTEYAYNGIQNLMVIVKSKSTARVSSAKFRSARNAVRKSLQWRSSSNIDLSNPGTSVPSYDREVYFYRPLINLISCLPTDCLRPEELHVTQTGYDNVTIAWNGNAPQYRVSVRAADSSMWRDEVVVNTTSYTVTRLHSARTYQFRVLSDCGSDVSSPWATIFFNTDTMPCAAPTEVHVAATGFRSVTIDWTSGVEETQWCVRVWNTAFDSLYYTDHHPFTIGGLASDVTYQCAVMTICGNGVAESDLTPTLTFTTASCPRVAGLFVSNITSSTAALSWNYCADSYQIEYGIGDFEQGSGTRVVVHNTEVYTITGLTPDRNYTVYVRARCDRFTYGPWSNGVRFRTHVSGIDDVEPLLDDVQIVPNPAGDIVNVLSSKCLENIKVYDMHGLVWLDETMRQSGSANGFRFSVANYPQGVYIVAIRLQQGIVTRKLVVQ